MDDVPHLCIDPHLLSLPQRETCSSTEVEDYVASIADWSKTIGIGKVKGLISGAVLEAIDREDAYPWQDKLSALIKQFNVQGADSKTVSDAIQGFFNSTYIEDSVGVRKLLLDEEKTKVVPGFVRERLRPQTSAAFCEQLAMVALAQKGYGSDVEQVALASLPQREVVPEFQYLSFTTEIADLEWQADVDVVGLALPHQVDDRVSVFFSRTGLLEEVEPLCLWPDTDDVDAACSAIDCCVARLIAAGADGTDGQSYSIGDRFLESARTWGCGQEGKHTFTLIESCARIVLNIPKQEVKPFEDGRGRQKARDDGALAYRTHLTKRGVALRLMLWKLPDGSIEFANVGNKAELVIL